MSKKLTKCDYCKKLKECPTGKWIKKSKIHIILEDCRNFERITKDRVGEK